MSIVPPVAAGLLPPPLLELLLQAAAPRATTAAMAAIAVVRLITFPFVDQLRPGRRPRDTDRRSRIRDKGLAACPRCRTHNQRRAGPMRVPGTAHRWHCRHTAARPIARAGGRPEEPEWRRGRYQYGAMRVSEGTG